MENAYLNYKSRGKSQTKRKTHPKVWHSKGALPDGYWKNATKNAKKGHARAKRHDLNNSCKVDQIDRDIKRLPKRICCKMKW